METEVRINETVCQIYEIAYRLAETSCDRCGQPAREMMKAHRTAIDVNLGHPILLSITVSVHHCQECEHYFRIQPPFMRPDAIYTNGVVEKAVQAVYEDRMAIRRVPDRLARDFWVRPSEGSVRSWCRTYSERVNFETDYQAWVINEFSGVLCVDEVYQGQLALLLAVDPAAPDGDRLVGYQLVHGAVDSSDMADFLSHLKAVGLEPEQVISDGSSLYPSVIKQVWPEAAHQLCLFHETRHLTKAAMKVIQTMRKGLPKPPPVVQARVGGDLGTQPPSDKLDDPAVQRWYWHQINRHARIALVHQLAQEGLSQRAIARQTGYHRKTVKKWLQKPVPPLPDNLPADLSEFANLSVSEQRQLKKQQQRDQVYALAEAGLNYSAIARQVGLHRVTVKAWLKQGSPLSVINISIPAAVTEPPPPPEPWVSWDQVRQVQEALTKHRFLFMRRPEHLSADEQAELEALLACPIGPQLQVARSFLVDWYQIWKNEDGTLPTIDEALALYDVWRTNPDYLAVSHLAKVIKNIPPPQFRQLSHFLTQPHWEATNNGAERTGRAFRHLQAPHFNLRKSQSIEGAIKIVACLDQAKLQQPPSEPFRFFW